LSNEILRGYASASAGLIDKYEAIDPAWMFALVRHLLPVPPARILDLGAGTGRDAAWLAGLGHSVVAVEPVAEFRQAGRRLHKAQEIDWVDDCLPELTHVLARDETFDLITLIAVWQHLEDAARGQVFANLLGLASPGGRVVLSIRNGPGAPDRPMFATHVPDLIDDAANHRFGCVFRSPAASLQEGNISAGVSWDWLVFEAI
jgi:2-polyprenyl-3-methyl-5-hydroxy-6-metoxy-1,4-benzoquinol methylase